MKGYLVLVLFILIHYHSWSRGVQTRFATRHTSSAGCIRYHICFSIVANVNCFHTVFNKQWHRTAATTRIILSQQQRIVYNDSRTRRMSDYSSSLSLHITMAHTKLSYISSAYGTVCVEICAERCATSVTVDAIIGATIATARCSDRLHTAFNQRNRSRRPLQQWSRCKLSLRSSRQPLHRVFAALHHSSDHTFSVTNTTLHNPAIVTCARWFLLT